MSSALVIALSPVGTTMPSGNSCGERPCCECFVPCVVRPCQPISLVPGSECPWVRSQASAGDCLFRHSRPMIFACDRSCLHRPRSSVLMLITMFGSERRLVAGPDHRDSRAARRRTSAHMAGSCQAHAVLELVLAEKEQRPRPARRASPWRWSIPAPRTAHGGSDAAARTDCRSSRCERSRSRTAP